LIENCPKWQKVDKKMFELTVICPKWQKSVKSLSNFRSLGHLDSDMFCQFGHCFLVVDACHEAFSVIHPHLHIRKRSQHDCADGRSLLQGPGMCDCVHRSWESSGNCTRVRSEGARSLFSEGTMSKFFCNFVQSCAILLQSSVVHCSWLFV